MGKGFSNDSKMSVIGQGTTFTGDCKIDGNIRIDGNFNGRLEAANTVVISKTGYVKGNISVQEAVIGGKVEGSITAKNKLELKSSAHIEADIQTRKLMVEEGAFLQGNCQMGEEKKPEKLSKEGSKIQEFRVPTETKITN